MENAYAAMGYSQANAATASPKMVEYQTFARVTAELNNVRETDKNEFVKIHEAVTLNLRLWNAIATDISYKSNPLPDELKKSLYHLYAFTRAHSKKVLDGDAAVDALIDVNTAIMKGLRGDTGLEETG